MSAWGTVQPFPRVMRSSRPPGAETAQSDGSVARSAIERGPRSLRGDARSRLRFHLTLSGLRSSISVLLHDVPADALNKEYPDDRLGLTPTQDRPSRAVMSACARDSGTAWEKIFIMVASVKTLRHQPPPSATDRPLPPASTRPVAA